ncbi:MAG: hypothetical protein M3010_02170 [Candidatus Dormibacteraeota bacterium]|nr:hypothetical protein [Candidatus Dormibacteraeota bacterium]
MPRRNRPPQRRSRAVFEVEPPPPTSAELARRLVRLGLADPVILGPERPQEEVDADARA